MGRDICLTNRVRNLLKIKNFNSVKFFSKFFTKTYSEDDINGLLDKIEFYKNRVQNKLRDFSNRNKFLVDENIRLYNSITTHENTIKDQHSKHVKLTAKLSKTITELTGKLERAEQEAKHLQKDLNECNEKFNAKKKDDTKESVNFLNKLLSRNQKLEDENKKLKDELKLYKPKVKK